jgi:hypothetical protein
MQELPVFKIEINDNNSYLRATYVSTDSFHTQIKTTFTSDKLKNLQFCIIVMKFSLAALTKEDQIN